MLLYADSVNERNKPAVGNEFFRLRREKNDTKIEDKNVFNSISVVLLAKINVTSLMPQWNLNFYFAAYSFRFLVFY